MEAVRKLTETKILKTSVQNILSETDKKLTIEQKEISMSLEDFEIPWKFHSEAPWPLAQDELLKVNKYRAPYDKYLCISRAWEIVSHYVSLIDDPGSQKFPKKISYVLNFSS